MLRSIPLLIVLALAGCDGGGEPDAGPPDSGFVPPIVLTANSVMAAASVPLAGGGTPLGAGPGNQFYIVDLTLEAREIGPIPIAPNALRLALDGGMSFIADADPTNRTTDGCVSRNIPLGASHMCRAVFLVPEDAAAPDRLSWSDGTRTVGADVPPLP
jgi:hypothetical protein